MPVIFDNPIALEETIDDVNLSVRQQSEAVRLKSKITELVQSNTSTILAYVGKFGSGKSTTLRNVESTYNNANEELYWLNFEAWRYVDRSRLWDGFVLEVSGKIGDIKTRDKTKDDIDGLRGVGAFVYRNLIKVACVVGVVWLIISVAVWLLLFNESATWALLLKAVLKYAIPTLFALLALIGVTTIFRNRQSPLTRVEELEELLNVSLQDLDRPLVVVVEDIDRAGEEGIVFLETLRNFLRTRLQNAQPLIIVAPQDITYMSALNRDKINGLERSIKIYGSALYYGSTTLTISEITLVLEQALIKEEYNEQISEALTTIINSYGNQFSMRMLKFALRELSNFSESQDVINPSIALILILIRYIKTKESAGSEKLLLDEFNRAVNTNYHLGGTRTFVVPIIKLLNKFYGVQRNISFCEMKFGNTSNEEINVSELENANGTVNTKLIINSRYETLLI